MSQLTPEQRLRGLKNIHHLREDLQSILNSKKVERGVGKCDLNSRTSFLKPNEKHSIQ